jgi:uncharacterized OB-fold protein
MSGGQSPRARFLEHAARGELAYQRGAGGRAVFPPRLVAPLGVGDPLEWAVSAGLGRVQSVTQVHPRGQEVFALALVDLDEGFRMMACVDADDPAAVTIGARVRVGFRALDADGGPLPVFALTEADGGQ